MNTLNLYKKTIFNLIIFLIFISLEVSAQGYEYPYSHSDENKVVCSEEQIQGNERGIGIYADSNIWKTEEIPDTSNDFVGLFEINGKYYMKPTKVHVVKGYNDCQQDSIQYLVPDKEDENCMFLFSNFKKYNKEEIKSIISEKKEIFPSEKFSFHFGKRCYELQALGEIEDNGCVIKNYKLLIYNKDI
jgi:hypothetical protein